MLFSSMSLDSLRKVLVERYFLLIVEVFYIGCIVWEVMKKFLVVWEMCRL